MTSSTSTTAGASSGSSPWSRESSMICWTIRESRSLSVSIRRAKRSTASGSSEASATASARSLIAPTGVFSSWDTLATKSRRTASTRRSRVRSSTRASTSRELSGATRAVTVRGGPLGRGSTRSASRIWPSRRTCRTSSASSEEARRWLAHQPEREGRRRGLDHLVVVVDHDRAAAQHREHGGDAGGERRAPRPGWPAACCRWLTCQARTAPPATTAPMSAARNACVVGLTPESYAARHLAFATARRARRVFTARSPSGPGWSPSPPTVAACAKPSTSSSTRSSTTSPRSAGGRDRRSAWPPRRSSSGDAEVAEQVIAADDKIDRARERVEDTAFSLLSLQQPVAGDLRVVVSALRMVSELERMGDLSVHVAKIARLRVPEIAVPEEARPDRRADGRGRRGHGAPGRRGDHRARRRGRDRARPRRRGDGPAASLRRSPSCSATTGSTASRRRSTSPCSAATTSGSPTTPSRSPTGWSSWSPASSPSRVREQQRPSGRRVRASARQRRDAVAVPRARPGLDTPVRRQARRAPTPRVASSRAAQRPWLATAAAASAAASGSRYCPPVTVGRRSSSSS